jgi:hypothetical protein
MLKLRKTLRPPQQAQQYTTALVGRRRAILCLGKDLKYPFAHGNHAAELRQLHFAMPDFAKAWALFADLRQSLSFVRSQAPAVPV